MQALKYVLYGIVALDAIILCVLILMQQGKSNGLAGLSGQVDSDTYWSKNRGKSAEGALEKGTRIAAVLLFIVIAVLNTTLFHG
ncbi:MAG: preprotein translocase subunit SecG [Eubacteriales bacterium]|nr:preprotein translocase subunit SecG [Eubacteriales bacterium]